jgi:pimeloyl-ACP methyl ester carboxylesterase
LTDAEVNAIRFPVTLVHGRLDRDYPPGKAVLPVFRFLPSADLFLFGECGHNVIWERTEAIVALVALPLSDK